MSQARAPPHLPPTPLSASLTLLDLAGTATVQGTYHIQVAANTNSVSAISLFSTGGLLATLTNQPTATFTFNGSTLGAGLHPFLRTGADLRWRPISNASAMGPAG